LRFSGGFESLPLRQVVPKSILLIELQSPAHLSTVVLGVGVLCGWNGMETEKDGDQRWQ